MIKIQKYGGTSVAFADQRRKIAKRIVENINKEPQQKIVVVVSAMGRKGSPYATDTLLSLIQDYSNISNSKVDQLMSCGEAISAVMLAAEIESLGQECELLSGWNVGIITDDNFTDANILGVDTKNIEKAFERSPVVVVTGFQGLAKSNKITTLGRGGSDTTAVALGAALRAETVEIYTDVDGVMTADPKVVTNPRKIKEISYEEIFEMANAGAKVVHPRAVELAQSSSLPLHIKSSSDGEGTVIRDARSIGPIKERNLITGIAEIGNLVQVNVFFSKEDKELELKLFKQIAKAGISIDLINISPYTKTFTIKSQSKENLITLLESLDLRYSLEEDCTKITVVGVKMQGKPGVLSEVLEPLCADKIPILQTADSHINISILVKSFHARKSVSLLHSALIENNVAHPMQQKVDL
ncbi:aspartate kinase [Proteinivorax hydrogeniformans]|uniref:Aspartokinase n=1 Tax=Proteinivorax hydrogeniformans TaxID=1826727 RepID=A0AAU8HX33_9FIRM